MQDIPISMRVPTRLTLGSMGDLPDGVTIKEKKQIFQFDAEGFSIMQWVFTVSSLASAALLAEWLKKKFIDPQPKERDKEVSICESHTVVRSGEEFVEFYQREIHARIKEVEKD
jgi:p-aminobenzoyl-glutamate transporter AbgT